MSLNRAQKDQFEVCIRNLPDRFDEERLYTLCSPYGQIVHLNVPRGDTGETKRHAYVTFATEDEAKQAIFRLHGTSIAGKEITVKLAKKTQESKRRPWSTLGRLVRKTLYAFFSFWISIFELGLIILLRIRGFLQRHARRQ